MIDSIKKLCESCIHQCNNEEYIKEFYKDKCKIIKCTNYVKDINKIYPYKEIEYVIKND